ncbi:MAG: PAS domain S-box protein [candidate division Zixibacteria bacterium]|nr:PAS domain S-box protein [candidate division Zixibacteria bacterium]
MNSESRVEFVTDNLQELLQKLAALAECVTDGIGVLDPDGRIVFRNSRLRKMLGCDTDDLAGRNVVDYLDPKWRGKFVESREAVRKGTLEPYELEMQTEGGTNITVKVLPKSVYDSEHRFVGSIGIFTDISELKRCEANTKRVSDTLRSLYDGVPIPTYTWQAKGDDIVLVDFNPAAAEITHGRVTDFVGKTASEMYANRPDIENDLAKCIKEKTTIKREMDYTHTTTSDVHDLIVTYSFLPPDQVLVCTEVATEHRKTSKQLLALDEKWRLLLRDSLDIIVNISRDGTILAVNHTISGKSPDEVIGKCMLDFISPEQREFVRSTIDQVFNSGSPTTYVVRATAPDGTFSSSYENRVVPLMVNNHVESVMIVSRDITDSRKAQEALKESEELYRTFFDGSRDAIFITGSDATFVNVNEAATALTGYIKDELVGMSITELHEPVDSATWEEYIKRIIAGESITSESDIRRKDGDVVRVEFSSKRILISGIPHVHSLARDVTERRKAEAARKESEDKFHALAEQNLIALYVLQENKIKFANQAASEMTEFSLEEIYRWDIKELFSKYIHPEDSAFVREQAMRKQAGMKAKVVPHYSYRIMTKSGKTKWVDQYSRSITFAGTPADFIMVVDITEQKEADEKLKESERFNRAVVENSPLGVSVRGRDGTLLSANKAWRKIWRFTDSEIDDMMTRKKSDLMSDTKIRYLGKWIPDVRRIYEQGGELHVPEAKVENPREGGALWVSQYFYAIMNRDGKVDRVVILTEDITDRKKIAQQLEDSEARFRTTLESSPDAIAVVGLDHAVSFCNQAAMELFGYESKDEIVGKSAFNFFVPEDRQTAAKNMEQMHSIGSLRNIESTMLRETGETFQAEVSAGFIRDVSGQPTAIVGVIKDITERKQQEAVLRESEEKFKVIAESTPIPVVISRQSDGKILFANSLIAPAFKYTDEELKNINSAVFYDDPENLRRVEKMLETGPVRNYEAKGRRSDGTTFWGTLTQDKIMFAGEQAYLGAFHDITEQKKIIEALRESEAKFRELADLLPQTIYEADTNGMLTFSNRHGFESTGYTQEDFDNGLNVLKLFNGADREKAKERMHRILQGERIEATEYDLVKKDGSTYPVLSYSSQVLRGGVSVGFRGIVIDITERKRAENELLRVNEDLRTERSKLEHANIALHEVLSSIEDRRKEVTKRVNTNMERLVQPILESLKRKSSEESRIIIKNLERTLEELTSPFTRDLETRISRLTPREIQICDMIRGGMRSGEIASALDISELTVQKFRQQIRKKLRINKKKINLASHLCSMSYNRLAQH